jgi:hypothetical protein
MERVAMRPAAAAGVAAVMAAALLVGCTSGPSGGSSTLPSTATTDRVAGASAITSAATASAGPPAAEGSAAGGTAGTASSSPVPTSAEVSATAPAEASVGTGTLTVAGERLEVAGDCVLAARRRRGGPLRPADQLTVAVTGRRGVPDPLSLTLTIADRDDRTVRVDADDGTTPRAWTGPLDQVRVVQPGGAATARLVFNATVEPVPGRASMPARTAGSSRRSGGDTASASPAPAGPSRVDPRPSIAPAPVPEDAGPVRVAASLTCRATTNDTQ